MAGDKESTERARSFVELRVNEIIAIFRTARAGFPFACWVDAVQEAGYLTPLQHG